MVPDVGVGPVKLLILRNFCSPPLGTINAVSGPETWVTDRT
jgi:hypothetical protein